MTLLIMTFQVNTWLIKSQSEIGFMCPILKNSDSKNQDGGVGRHTATPRTTRTDRKSNGKEVRHQGNKKKINIHPDREEGQRWSAGAERTRVAVVGPRLAECGTNRSGSLTTIRPYSPTFVQIN